MSQATADARTQAERHILVVDDEPASVDGVVLELKDRSFSVSRAETQASALAQLASTRFSAVLLDLMLPKAEADEPLADPPLAENGLSILLRLRNGEFEPHGTGRDVPVYVLCALAQETGEVIDEVKRMGVSEIFEKPTRTVLVAETIRLRFEEPRP